MTKDVTLYIGVAPYHAKYRFTDPAVWTSVRSQIITAMTAGNGLIEIDHKGDRVVYVYTPFLPVNWVEARD